MAIDLSGSSVVGNNYITSYREDDPAIGIVSSDVRVGNNSTTGNTDNIRHIKIRLSQPHPEDDWVITAMPAGIIVSLTLNGTAITVPSTLSAFTNPTLYLRTDGRVMPDAQWQNALKAIGFFADETIAPTRQILIEAQNSVGVSQAPVVTDITITAKNDAPNTTADAGEAIEAGGVNNTTPGSNATGYVLTNDWDEDGSPQDMIVSLVSFGSSSTDPGNSINGAYGTLTLQADGSYNYVVNNNNATVQGLRDETFNVTDTFTYMATDAGGASSSNTLTITIKGKDDTPFGIAVGQHFNGTAASVVAGPTLAGVSRDFAFELRVSPTNGIVLHAASLTGAVGTSGQEFAVTPLHGRDKWDNTDHVGVGLSVGTNGISVYQHTAGVLSSLLTWSGTVSANTHVAVVFNDNRPSLYVNGALMATGLQSTKLVHPPTELGGNGWGYFDGGISDFVVWHGALSAQDVAVRSLDPSLSDSATPALTLLLVSVPENAVEGTVVTTVRARDVDTSEVFTYSLTNDAQGRFLINAATGVVSVAPGAVFDHEAAHEITLTAKATDLAGESVLHNFTVTIGNVNEAPALINDAVDVSAGLITLMVDQDHGLWWLDGLAGQRSFVATANAPITSLARTAEGLYFATSADTLYRLDTATGQCLAVGALSASNLQMTGLGALRQVQAERERSLATHRARLIKEAGEHQTQVTVRAARSVARQAQISRTEVVAPADGVVKQIHARTVGQVVSPAGVLLDLVPQSDQLTVEARITPADVGFLQVGQPVKVKVATYDFAVYGAMDGVVESISADTLQDRDNAQAQPYYRVNVAVQAGPKGKDGQALPLTPGMTVSVDIVTGRKTVLTYLFKPLVRGMNQALGEK